MCKTQQIDLTVFFGIHSIKTASPGDHARAKGLGNYLAVTPAAPGVHEKKKVLHYHRPLDEIALPGVCHAH